MGGWTAATEVQQEMFSHLAFISVKLATLFEAHVEHLILWLQ